MPDGCPSFPNGFALYVSRWERENNPLLVAAAHSRSSATMGLVMLGSALYDQMLEGEVRAVARPDAWLPGAVYGAGYRGLLSHARCYIHATEVGGTHPALIEAMGAGNLCLVLDTPENREVAGDSAWYFADEQELTKLLEAVARLDGAELEALRARTRAVAAARYSWTSVAAAYDELLFGARATSSAPVNPPIHVR